MMRNIAVVGHLGHGKTSVMDMLISKTHEPTKYHKKQARYTDVHELERFEFSRCTFKLTIQGAVLLHQIDSHDNGSK